MEGGHTEEIASQAKEASLESKYGGIVPKKKPLISKDTKRAYFDSADWALGKQGTNMDQKTKATESLRPKLERTPHHQLPPRRPACTSGSGENRQRGILSLPVSKLDRE